MIPHFLMPSANEMPVVFLLKYPKCFLWKCSGLSVCPLESPKENELQEQVGPSLMGIKR